MTQTLNVLMLGGGNMAQAILAGFKRSGLNASLQLVEPVESLHKTLTQTSGIPSSAVHASLDALLEKISLTQFHWLVLAVKPQQAQEALLPILRQTQNMNTASSHASTSFKPALLSIAAGLSIQKLKDWSGLQAVIRCMPNIPAIVGQGIAGLYAPASFDAQLGEQANDLLRGLGPTVWLTNENEINTVTAISGSGPAYVFYFVECFMKAAQSKGLAPETSKTLAWQTVKGAVALLDSSHETAENLRAKVTSKGGTTAAAMEKLSAADLEKALSSAIEAAQKRARELS